uniref:Uncharacterized protein n=1 Tax=Sphaerodactylus townsendi TaxID=933632 RepID=A0ACB8F462_9SAUR
MTLIIPLSLLKSALLKCNRQAWLQTSLVPCSKKNSRLTWSLPPKVPTFMVVNPICNLLLWSVLWHEFDTCTVKLEIYELHSLYVLHLIEEKNKSPIGCNMHSNSLVTPPQQSFKLKGGKSFQKDWRAHIHQGLFPSQVSFR